MEAVSEKERDPNVGQYEPRGADEVCALCQKAMQAWNVVSRRSHFRRNQPRLTDAPVRFGAGAPGCELKPCGRASRGVILIASLSPRSKLDLVGRCKPRRAIKYFFG